MIAAYIRVSSRSPNSAIQANAIATAATARKDEIGAWYSEKKRVKIDRVDVAGVLELARVGELKKLYVYRLDRLASSIREVLTLINEFRAAGCEVVTVADGFELSGPAAEVIVAVMAWAAQMERLAIGGERIASARARIEREGGQRGRPRRVPPELELAILHRRNKLRSSIREIAEALKISKSTVADVLSGKGVYGRKK